MKGSRNAPTRARARTSGCFALALGLAAFLPPLAFPVRDSFFLSLDLRKLFRVGRLIFRSELDLPKWRFWLSPFFFFFKKNNFLMSREVGATGPRGSLLSGVYSAVTYPRKG